MGRTALALSAAVSIGEKSMALQVIDGREFLKVGIRETFLSHKGDREQRDRGRDQQWAENLHTHPHAIGTMLHPDSATHHLA
jgi:hypothetical protein